MVSGVSYSSRDPIERTLRTFAVDLSGNPGLQALLAQMRGTEVAIAYTVDRGDEREPERGQARGTILGIERIASGATVVNLLDEDEMSAVQLSTIDSVRLLTPGIADAMRDALELIASTKREEDKTVAVAFAGTGRRRVQVGYLLESPIWKTSYRLLVGEEEEHLLQGWGIVENTSDEDWRDVHLTLVSGQPISFRMDLYQPHYVQRPSIGLQVATAPRPSTFDEGLAPELDDIAPSAAPSTASRSFASRDDFDAGSGPTTEEVQRADRSSLAGASAQVAGELFQYAIDHPVTVPRNQSAMVPIVSTNISGRKLSIYRANQSAANPLNGLLLENDTGVDLAGGPLTVFESGVYGGDALISAFGEGATRLVAYSVDLDTRILTESTPVPEQIVEVRIRRGVLHSTRVLRAAVEYTLSTNRSPGREVLLEHAIRHGWDLVEPASVFERTAGAYRFMVDLATDVPLRLDVVEERRLPQTIALTGLSNQQSAVYVNLPEVSEALKAALTRLIELRAGLAQTLNVRQSREAEVNRIHREQSRIRQNMDALETDSALFQRYETQLGEQEDRLVELQLAITTLEEEEARRRTAIADFIVELSVD